MTLHLAVGAFRTLRMWSLRRNDRKALHKAAVRHAEGLRQ